RPERPLADEDSKGEQPVSRKRKAALQRPADRLDEDESEGKAARTAAVAAPEPQVAGGEYWPADYKDGEHSEPKRGRTCRLPLRLRPGFRNHLEKDRFASPCARLDPQGQVGEARISARPGDPQIGVHQRVPLRVGRPEPRDVETGCGEESRPVRRGPGFGR